MSKTHHHVLLTGAGFTHDFGGPLASEMWAWIYGHPEVQANGALRERMRLDFDFEKLYWEVVQDKRPLKSIASSERAALKAAVEAAYLRPDSAVCEFVSEDGETVGWSLRAGGVLRSVRSS